MFEKLKKELKKKITSARRRDILSRALVFAAQNKDSVVMILDPKKDDIIVAHGKQYAAANIRSRVIGMRIGVVKEILNGIEIERNIQRVLQVLDSFLYNFAIKINSKRSLENKEEVKTCQKENQPNPKEQKEQRIQESQKEQK